MFLFFRVQNFHFTKAFCLDRMDSPRAELASLFSSFIFTIRNGIDGDKTSVLPELARDFNVFVALTAMIGTLNWASRVMIVKPIARRALGVPTHPSKKSEAAVNKFAQAFMEMVFYGAFTFLNSAVFMAQPWSW